MEAELIEAEEEAILQQLKEDEASADAATRMEYALGERLQRAEESAHATMREREALEERSKWVEFVAEEARKAKKRRTLFPRIRITGNGLEW